VLIFDVNYKWCGTSFDAFRSSDVFVWDIDKNTKTSDDLSVEINFYFELLKMVVMMRRMV